MLPLSPRPPGRKVPCRPTRLFASCRVVDNVIILVIEDWGPGQATVDSASHDTNILMVMLSAPNGIRPGTGGVWVKTLACVELSLIHRTRGDVSYVAHPHISNAHTQQPQRNSLIDEANGNPRHNWRLRMRWGCQGRTLAFDSPISNHLAPQQQTEEQQTLAVQVTGDASYRSNNPLFLFGRFSSSAGEREPHLFPRNPEMPSMNKPTRP